MKIKQLIAITIIPLTFQACCNQTCQTNRTTKQVQKRIKLETKNKKEILNQIQGTWATYYKEHNNYYKSANTDHQNVFITINTNKTFEIQRFYTRADTGPTKYNVSVSSGIFTINSTPEKPFPAELILRIKSGTKPKGNTYPIIINKPNKSLLPIKLFNSKKTKFYSKFNGIKNFPTTY